MPRWSRSTMPAMRPVAPHCIAPWSRAVTRAARGPCVERIERAGVTGVVVGVEDPDPRVSGAGIRYLR